MSFIHYPNDEAMNKLNIKTLLATMQGDLEGEDPLVPKTQLVDPILMDQPYSIL